MEGRFENVVKICQTLQLKYMKEIKSPPSYQYRPIFEEEKELSEGNIK